MEIINQEKNLTLMGAQVKNFPAGVQEGFDSLMKEFGKNRDYYGISWCEKDNTITYFAITPETRAGEARERKFETFSIEKGQYKSEPVRNWRTQLNCIKDTFHELMGDKNPTKSDPCIEWYKSDEEMICMIKA